MSITITIYTSPTCTLCPQVLRLMDKVIPGRYDVVSLEDDAARELVVGQLHHYEAPVTVVSGPDGRVIDHWGRLSPERLRKHAANLAPAANAVAGREAPAA